AALLLLRVQKLAARTPPQSFVRARSSATCVAQISEIPDPLLDSSSGGPRSQTPAGRRTGCPIEIAAARPHLFHSDSHILFAVSRRGARGHGGVPCASRPQPAALPPLPSYC